MTNFFILILYSQYLLQMTASALQAGGRGFESLITHHIQLLYKICRGLSSKYVIRASPFTYLFLRFAVIGKWEILILQLRGGNLKRVGRNVGGVDKGQKNFTAVARRYRETNFCK